MSAEQTERSSAGKEIESSSEAEFSFGFEVSTGSIADLFEEVAGSLGFEMIEKELQHATAIKQTRKSLLQYLDCFNWVSEGAMTALKLTVHTSEKNSLRIVRLKGLIGSKREVRGFVEAFRARSEALVRELPFQLEESEQMLEEPDNPFHLEACAAYMFHKILSNEKYGIGNVVGLALKNYANDYSDVEKAVQLLPLPMKSAMYFAADAGRSCGRQWTTSTRTSTWAAKRWRRSCPTAAFRSSGTCSTASRACWRRSTRTARASRTRSSRRSGRASSRRSGSRTCSRRSTWSGTTGSSRRGRRARRQAWWRAWWGGASCAP